MNKAIDITDNRYGKLVVLHRQGNTKHGKAAWLCQCDCGKQTVACGESMRGGKTKSCGCWQSGDNHPNWKGGIRHYTAGYIGLLRPGHANSDKKGYILEHRLVMSKHLGRPLTSDEVIHHINGIKDDNRLENLELYITATHRVGQNINGLIQYGVDILKKYAPEKLK